jgi:hypothetical protein
MSRRMTTAAPAPRIIHYIDPAPTAQTELLLHTAAELAARRHREQALYARWVARQAAITESDRRTHRFLLGFGATVALVLLAGCGVVGWLTYHAITTTAAANAGAWLGGLIIGALVLTGAVVGSRRCVTIIEHRH